MLGTGTDVPATRELIFEEKLVTALWKVIYGRKGLIPTYSKRTNCKTCNSSNENHYQHLTSPEKELDTIARCWLERLKGTFNK